MKSLSIRFFSPVENSQAKQKTEKPVKPAKVKLTGYVSSTGKLVLPDRTVASLDVDLNTTSFKVGIEEGKRKAKSLYLIPASDGQETFGFEKAAKSYSLALPYILKKSGVDFTKSKYEFKIRLFEYEGRTAFELQLSPEAATPKVPYTGKPRGRKAKQEQVSKLI